MSAGIRVILCSAEEVFTFDEVDGRDERSQQLAVAECLAADLGTDPRGVLSKLGITHALLVDRRLADGVPSLLLARDREDSTVWTVDPRSVRDRPASEAFLPTEMDFPLTGLWSVERPGPLLELVQLRP